MKTISILVVAAMALLALPSLAQEEPDEKPAVESPDTTNKHADEHSADEAIDKAKDATNKAIETAKNAIIKAIEKAKKHSSSAIETGKEATEDALGKASKTTEILDKVAEATREILDKVKQATSEILEKAKEVTEQKSEADEPPDAPPAPPAQSATESDLRKVKDDDRMVDAWKLKVDQVEDRDVYGPDGKEVGEIEKVLEDGDGQIRAVVVEFGGFLGFGDTEVIVPLDQLQPGKEHFTTKLTQQQLSAFPAWKK